MKTPWQVSSHGITKFQQAGTNLISGEGSILTTFHSFIYCIGKGGKVNRDFSMFE